MTAKNELLIEVGVGDEDVAVIENILKEAKKDESIKVARHSSNSDVVKATKDEGGRVVPAWLENFSYYTYHVKALHVTGKGLLDAEKAEAAIKALVAVLDEAGIVSRIIN